MSMKKVIGTCSRCGGTVSVPRVYHSVLPPTPTCDSCGAVKKLSLPVIETEEPRAPDNRGLLLG